VFDKEKVAFRTPDLNYIIAGIARQSGDSDLNEEGTCSFLSEKSLLAEKEGPQTFNIVNSKNSMKLLYTS